MNPSRAKDRDERGSVPVAGGPAISCSLSTSWTAWVARTGGEQGTWTVAAPSVSVADSGAVLVSTGTSTSGTELLASVLPSAAVSGALTAAMPGRQRRIGRQLDGDGLVRGRGRGQQPRSAEGTAGNLNFGLPRPGPGRSA